MEILKAFLVRIATALSPRAWRRVLSGLAALLALVGVSLVAYPFATDLWATRIQQGLAGQLAASAGDYQLGKIGTGDPLTRLQIPKLDVDVIVVEGTTLAALHAGAGHYPRTALPGERGNVAIAGHRTTYGKPLARMDELERGDRIVLTTPVGRHVYEVIRRPWVVDPTDWTPIEDFPRGASLLTLTSCHPEGSAAYRIVARAKLVSSDALTASEVSAG